MQKILILTFILISSISFSQTDSLRVLFLGNSYTSVNNLPIIVEELANYSNRNVHTELHTPGGHTLEQHSINESSLLKIRKGDWDFVVLQEQSQIPTIDFHKENSMYPAARRLNDSIKKYNPCAKTLFYMTWGRRFGGQQCDDSGVYCSPDFVDFTHMQDSLESAYWGITQELNALVAPVGIAWKKVINENETILHAVDNSHPNYSGTYLAACVFHSMMWNIYSFENSFIGNLDEEMAQLLQSTADSIVFHSYNNWNLHISQVNSDFSFEVFNDFVQFNNLSECIQPMIYHWDFDDGEYSSEENPSHNYQNNQTYEVKLISQYCENIDTAIYDVFIDVNTDVERLIPDESIFLSPNPFQNQLNIQFNNAVNYQIDLINDLGNIIHSIDGKQEKLIHFPTEKLSNGIYFVRITNQETKRISTCKILKSKI
ncbi:T9SS type A sorting domain-containing protein [Lentimicrobium sp. L6]|nr:T9SS type A sorting domain-containing protein [Lentimicrobium sp. L6]NPD86423.1 T9SS type A sorting domain-containing protein [Lentimicrobium sp. L6]